MMTAMRAAAAFAIGLLLLLIDPFGFSATLDRVGRDAFYKVMAPTFEEDEVSATVVLVDDAFLARQGLYWPLPYQVHGELLRAIASYGPDAIFVDVVFFDELPDPTLPHLVATLEAIAETTPVFLAVASSETGAATPIRPELQALADRSPGISLVSILYGGGQGTDLAYRLAPDQSGHEAAAPAIYRAVCASHPSGCHEIETGADLDLVWGLPARATCLRATGDDPECVRIAYQPLLRFFRLFAGGALGGAAPPFLSEPNPLAIPGVPSVSAGAVSQGAYRAQLAPFLAGRAVFYGANLALSSDRVRSPVNGETPGVFAHATAFANLELYGARYVRAQPPLGLPAPAHTALLLALAIVTGYAIEWAAVRRHLPPATRLRLQIADHLVLAIVVTAIEYGVLRSGPANWWGVFSAVAVARWMVDRMKIGSRTPNGGIPPSSAAEAP